VQLAAGLGQVHPERRRHHRAFPVGRRERLAHRHDRLRHADQTPDVSAVKDPDRPASCLEASACLGLYCHIVWQSGNMTRQAR
jgi:hypothetical protein